RNALLGIASTAAERSLNGTSISDETAIPLQSAFSRVKSTNSLSRAFIGEQGMGIPVFRLSWAEIQRSSQENEADPSRHPEPVSHTIRTVAMYRIAPSEKDSSDLTKAGRVTPYRFYM